MYTKLVESMIKILIIGDFGLDLDDEFTLIILKYLISEGYLNESDVIGVVGNFYPALLRAKIAKGTLNKLGLNEIPVCVGDNIVDYRETVDYEQQIPYIANDDELVNWYSIVNKIQHLEDKSLTIVLESGMTDMMKLMVNFPKVIHKIKEVVIMGGVYDPDGILKIGKYFIPDSANNNTFDWGAANYVYGKLQELNIPMIITTRHLAYSCQLPFSVYDSMVEIGNDVGICLKNRQQGSINHLWKSANEPAGSKIRGSLPPRCDRKWFCETFLDGNDPGDIEDIYQKVSRFNLYDPMNLVAAIPALRKKFFRPFDINVNGIKHQIIGLSNSVIDIDELRRFMINAILCGLKSK